MVLYPPDASAQTPGGPDRLRQEDRDGQTAAHSPRGPEHCCEPEWCFRSADTSRIWNKAKPPPPQARQKHEVIAGFLSTSSLRQGLKRGGFLRQVKIQVSHSKGRRGTRKCEARQRRTRGAAALLCAPEPHVSLGRCVNLSLVLLGQGLRENVLPLVPQQGGRGGTIRSASRWRKLSAQGSGPQQCSQNAKPHSLRPGLSSKARSGGRSQRCPAHVWSAWLVAAAKEKGLTPPRARARLLLQDGTTSRAGGHHQGHPRLAFNTVNQSPEEPGIALPATSSTRPHPVRWATCFLSPAVSGS